MPTRNFCDLCDTEIKDTHGQNRHMFNLKVEAICHEEKSTHLKHILDVKSHTSDFEVICINCIRVINKTMDTLKARDTDELPT